MERPGTKVLVRALLVVACVMGIAWPGVAGTGYNVKCSECDFEASFLYGGEIPSDGPGRVVLGTGYCCSCEKVVRVFSNPGAAEKDADAGGALGEVFCHDNGKTYTLYACPTCGKPFIAIEAEEFMKDGKPVKLYCPKCGKKSLQATRDFVWD